MQSSPQLTKVLWFLLALLLLALLGWNHVVELRAEEPRRALVALEMVLTGDYWVPHINGWSYYNKPPVFNWLIAGGYHLLGSYSEWVVRLPSLLAFLAIGYFQYRVVRRYLNAEVALLSSFFTLTAADLLFYGSVNAGEIDLFFSALVWAQVMCIFIFYQRKQFLLLFLLSYFFAAIGTLTKGPPSIAFQALTIVPWLVIHREWRLLFGWQHLLGGLLFLGIVGGYFYSYDQYDDGLGFVVRLFKEASQRTGLEHQFTDTLLGALSFPFFLAKLFLPWSLLVIFMVKKGLWSEIKQHRLLFFSVVFLGFNLLLYWWSADHRSRYLYMFIPFCCILVSYFWWKNKKEMPRLAMIFDRLFLGIMGLITLAFFVPLFLKETAVISALLPKCIGLFLVGTALCLAYQKMHTLRIYFFIAFLLVFRIGLNLIYLPAIEPNQKETSYRTHTAEILKITQDQQIYWTGKPHVFKSDASIGPLQFSEVTLTTAQLLAYQIPYYLSKGNEHVLQFDPEIIKGRYYLARAETLKDRPIEALYRFRDRWMNKELILFLAK